MKCVEIFCAAWIAWVVGSPGALGVEIPNGSADLLDPESAMPAGWQFLPSGSAAANFTVTSPGHTGPNAVRIDLVSAPTGDARWLTPAADVLPGIMVYRVSVFYRSNTTFHLAAKIFDQASQPQDIDIQEFQAASQWTEAAALLTVPSSGRKVQLAVVLNRSGYLEADDFGFGIPSGDSPLWPPAPEDPPVAPPESSDPPLDQGGMLANGSVEIADSTQGWKPQEWQTSSWGDAAANFTYLAGGHDGQRSLRVAVWSLTAGDAKWVSPPIRINQATSVYDVSDYYQSSVPTRLVVRIETGTDTPIWAEVASLAPAQTWTQAKGTVIVPLWAPSFQVMHIIETPGVLDTDQYQVYPSTSPPTGEPTQWPDNPTPETTPEVPTTVPVGTIDNPSVELTDPQSTWKPLGWQPQAWGQPAVNFTYAGVGYAGARSIRIDMWAGGSGDAKWLSPAVAPSPLTSVYQISDYYQASVETRLMVELFEGDEESGWRLVAVAPKASDWTLATGTVILPAGTTAFRVAHVIEQPGTLQTDAYALSPAESPPPDNPDNPDNPGDLPNAIMPASERPLVSLAFDEGWLSAYTNAVPDLDAAGYKASFYVYADYLDRAGYNQDYMDSVQLLTLAMAGHEIGSHGLEYADWSSLTAAQVHSEIVDSRLRLESYGLNVSGFVPCEPAPDSALTEQILAAYDYVRLTGAGFNAPPYDVREILVQVLTAETTAAEVTQWLESALQQKSWLILMVQRVDEDGSSLAVSGQTWSSVMSLLLQYQADVHPVGEVLGSWQADIHVTNPPYDVLEGDETDNTGFQIPTYPNTVPAPVYEIPTDPEMASGCTHLPGPWPDLSLWLLAISTLLWQRRRSWRAREGEHGR